MFVNKNTKIEESVKLFDIPDTTSGKPVPLRDIDKMPTQTFITIEIKVSSVKEPIFIESKGLSCQEMTVANQSGAVRLSLWENEINTMKRVKGTVLKMCLCVNM